MSEWQPIETAPKGVDAIFWVRPLTIEDDHFVDTSGIPILAGDQKSYWIACKYGGWSSLMKATHWMPEPSSPVSRDGN